MKVLLRNPRREVEVTGGRRVKDVLRELDVIPETVIVIRGDTLITADQIVADTDTIELRPVMSGGRASRGGASGEASPSMIVVVRAEAVPPARRALQ
jgi:sulfur carrier protein